MCPPSRLVEEQKENSGTGVEKNIREKYLCVCLSQFSGVFMHAAFVSPEMVLVSARRGRKRERIREDALSEQQTL